MFRPSMPANEGMLFSFERPAQQCFWMKNTLIPARRRRSSTTAARSSTSSA
jgi:hypothetical protein